MNLYESILGGSKNSQKIDSNNGLVTSTSIPAILTEASGKRNQFNRFCDSGMKSSPESTDSGIHSESSITSQQNGKSTDSIYSSVTTSSNCTMSISSKLDTESSESNALPPSFKHLEQNELPPGWIKCCDEVGIYYWHKPSGTVTRKPPNIPSNNVLEQTLVAPQLPKKKFNIDEYVSFQQINELINGNTYTDNMNTLSSSSSTSTSTSASENNYYTSANESLAEDLSSLSVGGSLLCESSKNVSSRNSQRFYVRSLGWVKIDENDLTPERSSKAVNRCINELSRGLMRDLNDVVASWGEGKDLYMDLEDSYLILSDTNNNKMLNKQSITSIRVWGVGRDNGSDRDFAYVARDKQTKTHMCHVFRCDSAPAKEIANTLRDACRRIISEKKNKTASVEHPHTNILKRPHFLPEFMPSNDFSRYKSASCQDQNEMRTTGGSIPKSQTEVDNLKFLNHSVDEPKKAIRCKYLGECVVARPSGMDMLNEAIEKIYVQSLEKSRRINRQNNLKNKNNLDFFSGKRPNEYEMNEDDDDDDDDELDYDNYDYPDNAFSFDLLDLNRDKKLGIDVEVVVSPSTVTVKKVSDYESEGVLVECRVRYLSFMGISNDVRLCGFIVHCIDNTFKCHAFLCENTSSSLMKVIEAACKLRYQKCLDAHPEAAKDSDIPKFKQQTARFSNFGMQIKGVFDSIKSRSVFSNYSLSESKQEPK